MLRFIRTAVLAMAFSSVAAQAQDAATLAASEKLMAKMEVSQTLTMILPQMGQQIVASLAQNNPAKQADAREAWVKWIEPEMRAMMPTFEKELAKIYAQTFTAKELDEFAAFYDTPVGKKFIANQTELSLKTMALASQWGQTAARTALQKHSAQIRAKGLNL